MSDNLVLEAKSVSKFFGTITALQNVDLHLNKGEVLGVVGDNGAGKSTLMKVLSGLYKPSEGSLFFDKEKVTLSKKRDPSLGLYNPDKTFINVDFPAPLSPTTPRTSPLFKWRSTFWRAVIVPKNFETDLASSTNWSDITMFLNKF